MLIAKTRIKLHRPDGAVMVDIGEELPDLTKKEEADLRASDAVIDQDEEQAKSQADAAAQEEVAAKFAAARAVSGTPAEVVVPTESAAAPELATTEEEVGQAEFKPAKTRKGTA
jgi:hypothetical protein